MLHHSHYCGEPTFSRIMTVPVTGGKFEGRCTVSSRLHVQRLPRGLCLACQSSLVSDQAGETQSTVVIAPYILKEESQCISEMAILIHWMRRQSFGEPVRYIPIKRQSNAAVSRHCALHDVIVRKNMRIIEVQHKKGTRDTELADKDRQMQGGCVR